MLDGWLNPVDRAVYPPGAPNVRTMTATDVTDAPPAGPEPRPEPSSAWWIFSGIIMFVGTVVLLVSFFVEVPFFANLPGPALRTDEFVTIPDVAAEEASGDFYLLTVLREPVTLAGYVQATLDDRVDLIPREAIIPPGSTSEDKKRADQQMMEDSQQVAIAVALERAGYDVSFASDGVEVGEVAEGSAADGVFEEGDVIIAFEGEPVFFSGDLVSRIQERSVGEVVGFTVVRNEAEMDLKVTLGERGADDPTPIVGITIFTIGARFDFPIEVEIESQNVGGPSAGMMFAITIIDELSDVDLTGGHRIAGTGTIESDGTVGPVGGIKQKVFGAMNVGAELMLVPDANYETAAAAAGDNPNIELVAVSDIDEALEAISVFAGWSVDSLGNGSR